MAEKIYGRNDVARLAGVAPSTVSHVINRTKFVSEPVRERVLAAIKELNYEPNLLARSLRGQRTYQIIVFISDLYNSYYADICNGVIEEAEKNGYSVLVGITQNQNRDMYKEYNLRQVDGIINFSNSFCSQEYYEKLCARKTAMVNCRAFDEEFSVGVNYVHAVEEFANRLKQKGRRNVALLADSPLSALKDDTRYIALKYNLELNGIPFRDDLVIASEAAPYGVDMLKEGYNRMQELLERENNIDGVLCINDLMAFGARNCLEQNGKRVPVDVSVCGCDDVFFSDFLTLRLSTMGFDKEEFGRICVRSIMAQIRGETYEKSKSTVFAEFIDRDSV